MLFINIMLLGQRIVLKLIKFSHSKEYFYKKGKIIHKYFIVDCVCGKQFTAYIGHIKSGHTVSCGCLKKDKISIANSIHGNKKRSGATREYTTCIQRGSQLNADVSIKIRKVG
jgi:hypothetical protein